MFIMPLGSDYHRTTPFYHWEFTKTRSAIATRNFIPPEVLQRRGKEGLEIRLHSDISTEHLKGVDIWAKQNPRSSRTPRSKPLP